MKKIISTDDAPKSVANYSQAIEANGFLYISGQIAIDPTTGKMIEGDLTEQAKQVFKNADAILKAAGYERSDVIKTTCLLADIKDYVAMNTVYQTYFTANPPARAAFATAGLPLGALFEMELIATKS